VRCAAPFRAIAVVVEGSQRARCIGDDSMASGQELHPLASGCTSSVVLLANLGFLAADSPCLRVRAGMSSRGASWLGLSDLI
jgi:hypothetical protein